VTFGFVTAKHFEDARLYEHQPALAIVRPACNMSTKPLAGRISASIAKPRRVQLLLGGVDRVLLAVVVACLVAGLLEIYRQSMSLRLTPYALVVALLLPFSAACFGWAIARSVYLAETRGVRWRGTTYPLSLLRSQSGLEGIAANRSR